MFFNVICLNNFNSFDNLTIEIKNSRYWNRTSDLWGVSPTRLPLRQPALRSRLKIMYLTKMLLKIVLKTSYFRIITNCIHIIKIGFNLSFM